jgi:ferredoxin
VVSSSCVGGNLCSLCRCDLMRLAKFDEEEEEEEEEEDTWLYC